MDERGKGSGFREGGLGFLNLDFGARIGSSFNGMGGSLRRTFFPSFDATSLATVTDDVLEGVGGGSGSVVVAKAKWLAVG